MKKKMPKFKSEDQEREFWSKADSTEYLDWAKAKRAILPNLKPSVKKTITDAAKKSGELAPPEGNPTPNWAASPAIPAGRLELCWISGTKLVVAV